MLILIARPTHRLPATICKPLACDWCCGPPRREVAAAWLEAHGPDRNWDAALGLAGGAPLLAVDLHNAGIAALETEMQEGMRTLAAGTVDVTVLAEHWARSNLGLRVAWLENWITGRIHSHLGETDSKQSAERVPLACLFT